MAELLLFILGDAPQAPLRWGAFADGSLADAGWLRSADELTSLAERAAAANAVVALLPGEQAACRAMPAAPRGAAKLNAAATFLMEDELGEPVESLAIAVGANHSLPVAIACRRNLLETWKDVFAAAGIECDCLAPDFLALPSAPGSAFVIAEGDRVVVSLNGGGAAFERDLFDRLAPQLFAEPLERISGIGNAGVKALLPSAQALDWLGEADDARILAAFGAAVSEQLPPSFLKRRWFRARAFEAAIAPWRRSGAMAAGLAALGVISFIAGGIRDARLADRWESAAAALHAKAFPDAAAEDPVTHARAMLASGAGHASFLDLSSRLSSALEGEEDVQVDRIRFNSGRGEFLISIRSKTDADIEEFRVALGDNGVAAVDSGGYRNNGDFWTGELSARMQ